MANLYNKIEFKDFSLGQGKKFIRDSKEVVRQFHLSSKVSLDRLERGLVLSLKPVVTTISAKVKDGHLSGVYSIYFKNLVWFVVDNGTNIDLYKENNLGAAFKSFAANTTDTNHFVAYKDKMILFYNDGVDEKFAYSTDGTNFTEDDWIYGDVLYTSISNLGVLYIATADYILSTDDGIFFTVFYNATTEDYKIDSIAYMNGFLYAVIKYKNSSGVRFFVRFEDDKPFFLESFNALRTSTTWGPVSLIGLTSDVLLVGFSNINSFEIWAYSANGFTLVAFIKRTSGEDYFAGRFLFSDGEKVFFAIQTDAQSLNRSELYTINTDFGVFHYDSYANTAAEVIFGGVRGSDTLYIHSANTDDLGFFVSKYTLDTENYNILGSIALPIIDIGRIIPRHIVLSHDSLEVDTIIKVYVKKDEAASWGSAIIISSVDGDIRSTHVFAKAQEGDKFQFKIELIGLTTKSPRNVVLTFLYKKSGIENSGRF